MLKGKQKSSSLKYGKKKRLWGKINQGDQYDKSQKLKKKSSDNTFWGGFCFCFEIYLIIRGDRNGHVGEQYKIPFSASTQEARREGQHFLSVSPRQTDGPIYPKS